MSSDEDDYMSDKFLAKEAEDIRPGLSKRKVDQHAFEQYKKKLKSAILNQKEQESIKRDEGLNTALSSTNKGFQMLAKMGYKTDTSLGASNTGIIQPIGINLKTDKGGLGKKKLIPISKQPSIKVTKEMEENYRKNVQLKKHIQFIRKFYFKAQSSCMNLDHLNEVELPVKEFYWPRKYLKELKEKGKKLNEEDDETYSNEYNSDKSEEENEDDEEINEETLVDIVRYLRKTYFYCIYCAAKGEDENDLDSFCPGESYDDHNID